MVSEGSVQLSTQMLTAIPEVDLGIEYVLLSMVCDSKTSRHLVMFFAQMSTTVFGCGILKLQNKPSEEWLKRLRNARRRTVEMKSLAETMPLPTDVC